MRILNTVVKANPFGLHPRPAEAKSDGANMLRLDLLEPLLKRLVAIRRTIDSF